MLTGEREVFICWTVKEFLYLIKEWYNESISAFGWVDIVRLVLLSHRINPQNTIIGYCRSSTDKK